MSRLRAFASLTRPVFLLGGALLYGLGAALSPHPVDWTAYLIGQALVTTIQLSAQYTNEYYDQRADGLSGANRTWLTGGSGILASGRLAPSTALRAATITALAALVAVVAVTVTSGAAGLVGLAALIGALAYSAPPARLVSTLAGVSTASLIVAGLTPLTGALIQGGVPADRLLAIVIPLVILHHAMLIAFEHPDLAGDSAAGKRTLSVRLGAAATARLHGVLLVAAFSALAGAAAVGPLSWGEVAWATGMAPLGLLQAWSFTRPPEARLVTVAVGLFSGTVVALLVGVT